jgi:ubiquinone/menaquinone biosynthesis C-methylase UbiE
MSGGLPAESDLEKEPYSLYEGIEYNRFWTGWQKRNLNELEHALVREMLPAAGCRIVDIGCGYGRLAECYLGRFQQVIMVDGSLSLLRQARDVTRGQAIYIASDVRHLPFRTAAFDAALLIRVFHHITDSQGCLSEVHRLLCNDGRFVFSYFNKRHALRVIRWLLGAHTENPFTIEPTGVGSTLISHHPWAVQCMLHESGFSNIQYYGTGVLDRLIAQMGRTGNGLALAKHLAPFFARSKIAPWILGEATAIGNSDLYAVTGISDLLQCPCCGGDLAADQAGYWCLLCHRHYPANEGIIDLRVHFSAQAA